MIGTLIKILLASQKLLFLDGYFNQYWTYSHLNSLFSILKLKPIKLKKEQLKICDQNVVIHIRGGLSFNKKPKYMQT